MYAGNNTNVHVLSNSESAVTDEDPASQNQKSRARSSRVFAVVGGGGPYERLRTLGRPARLSATYDGNPLGWRAHGRNARGQADHEELAHMVVN